MPTTVLLADDDVDAVEGLRWYLEAAGYQVTVAHDGHEALARFRAESPEVAILDIMMPGLDGVKVCAAMRQESPTIFIMMLTARDGEIDRVHALDTGADDYLTKPFYATELVARIRALLRRAGRGAGTDAVLRWGALEIRRDERRALVNNTPVPLSAMEFDLLTTLIGRPRVVFSREQLAEILWGDDFYGELRLVDNHVYRLRDKLNEAGLAHTPIVTVRGVGYAFRPDA